MRGRDRRRFQGLESKGTPLLSPATDRRRPSCRVFLLGLVLLTGPVRAGNLLPGDPLPGDGTVERQALLYDELATGAGEGPVGDSAFALPPGAAAPVHELEGVLELGRHLRGDFQLLRDSFELGTDGGVERLPQAAIGLVQSGSYLVPVERGLVVTGHRRWNLIVGPGRIWQERGDGGSSRITLPFTLVERSENCTHNGMMTFLFDGKAVSPVRFQVTQETCLYFKFDLWGVNEASWESRALPEAESTKVTFAEEMASRLPTRPLAELAARLPGIDVARLTGDVPPEHLTTWGVVVDGIHYRGPARTRTGDYPFPDFQRLPSYSTAKTAFAAMALWRLVAQDGEAVAREPLAAWLPEAGGGLDGVTFGNAIDMATGHYRSPEPMADEDDLVTGVQFIRAEPFGRKLRTALDVPRREAPGQRWVYHTPDTFLVTLAMTRYLRHREGDPAADLFDWLVGEVYRPLGLSSGTFRTLRTDNSPGGQPFGGYGLFWLPDDVAKVGVFLSDEGRLGDRQLLDRRRVRAALQREPSDPGLAAVHHGRAARYNDAMWALPVTLPAESDGGAGEETVWVPFLSGYGGNVIAILPGGVVYYHFGDENEYGVVDAARTLLTAFRARDSG